MVHSWALLQYQDYGPMYGYGLYKDRTAVRKTAVNCLLNFLQIYVTAYTFPLKHYNNWYTYVFKATGRDKRNYRFAELQTHMHIYVKRGSNGDWPVPIRRTPGCRDNHSGTK